MVEGGSDIGTRRARSRLVTERAAADGGWKRRVWIVEDEPAAASLGVELCESCDAEATVFGAPLPYLAALRGSTPPSAVILDWRLEHELSAGLFLATRHRYPHMPIICWTGSVASALPSMIREDASTRIVDKAAGTASFERALGWALEGSTDEEPG